MSDAAYVAFYFACLCALQAGRSDSSLAIEMGWSGCLQVSMLYASSTIADTHALIIFGDVFRGDVFRTQ